jgi:hypothetical protein
MAEDVVHMMSIETLEEFVTSTPQGPHKFATILSQEAKQLRFREIQTRSLSSRSRPSAGREIQTGDLSGGVSGRADAGMARTPSRHRDRR